MQRHGSQLTFCLPEDFNTNIHYSKQCCKNKGEQKTHLKSYTMHTAPFLVWGLRMNRGLSSLHLQQEGLFPPCSAAIQYCRQLAAIGSNFRKNLNIIHQTMRQVVSNGSSSADLMGWFIFISGKQISVLTKQLKVTGINEHKPCNSIYGPY